jgi:hypothetical protein
LCSVQQCDWFYQWHILYHPDWTQRLRDSTKKKVNFREKISKLLTMLFVFLLLTFCFHWPLEGATYFIILPMRWNTNWRATSSSLTNKKSKDEKTNRLFWLVLTKVRLLAYQLSQYSLVQIQQPDNQSESDIYDIRHILR